MSVGRQQCVEYSESLREEAVLDSGAFGGMGTPKPSTYDWRVKIP